MRVLALDTCLGAVSVGVRYLGTDGNWAIAAAYEERRTGHAERLVPMMAEVLAAAGMSAGDVQRVAVTLGPGSFTGVRTGLAAARAFRLSAGVDVVGMTSLALIAHRAFAMAGYSRGDGRLLVAVDARRDRLYVQLFGASAHDALTPALEVTPAEAQALAGAGPLLLAGSGAEAVAAAASGRGVTVVASELEPQASDLAGLAIELAPLKQIEPIYIRPPDAKPQVGKSLERTP